MPELNGIDVLRKIKDKVLIAVFITSHPEFALDGFDLSALDYIIKPLTAERFAVTAKRVEEYCTNFTYNCAESTITVFRKYTSP